MDINRQNKWLIWKEKWAKYEEKVLKIIKDIIEKYNIIFVISTWENKQLKWKKWWDIDILVWFDKLKIPIQVKYSVKWKSKINKYSKKWIEIIDWKKNEEELKYFITLLFLKYLQTVNKSLWQF